MGKSREKTDAKRVQYYSFAIAFLFSFLGAGIMIQHESEDLLDTGLLIQYEGDPETCKKKNKK